MQLRITDDPSEMIEIGKQIVAEKRYLYTDKELENLRHTFAVFGGDYVRDGDFIFQYVYDHWMYGVNSEEEYTYRFRDKTHAEKSQYLTWDNRFQYYAVLNSPRDIHILDNKYEAYLKLKKYYKREAILVSDREDLALFRQFIQKHGRVIVKPVNLYLTIGLRWLNANEITDYSALLDELIESAQNFAKIDSSSISKPAVIVEELLDDCSTVPPFNREVLSPIRCTTVLTKDGVQFFYPAFRTTGPLTKDDQGIDYEKTDVFISSIDIKTGRITSGGYNYFGQVFEKHPSSGLTFEGTQLPDWDQLLQMLTEAALANIRYPLGLQIDGQEIRIVASWQDCYLSLCEKLNELDGTKFGALPDQPMFKRFFIRAIPHKKYADCYPAKLGAAGDVRAKVIGSKSYFYMPNYVVYNLLKHYGIDPQKVTIRA